MGRIKLAGTYGVAALTLAVVLSPAAWGAPFVRATPHKNLVNGEVVTVTGGEFARGSQVLISECEGRTHEISRVERSCYGATAQSVTVSSTGRIPATPFTIYKGAFNEELPYSYGDECGDALWNKTCYIAALDGNDIAYTAISLEIPELLVTPNTSLVNGQEVMVSGKNFLPGSQLNLDECVNAVKNYVAPLQPEFCAAEAFSSVVSNGEGAFPPTPLTVRTGVIASGNVSPSECGTSQATEHCYLRAADSANDRNNDGLGKITFVP